LKGIKFNATLPSQHASMNGISRRDCGSINTLHAVIDEKKPRFWNPHFSAKCKL